MRSLGNSRKHFFVPAAIIINTLSDRPLGVAKRIYLFFKLCAVWILSTSSLYALEVGDRVPDFVMPAVEGAPQRLSEYIGQPVMLVWLNDCDNCSEDLIDWQYFAESRADDGLKTFFIWNAKKGNKSPWSRLPILEYNKNNKNAWWFGSEPVVMFINPDGILDFVYQDNVEARKSEILDELKNWLNNRRWLKVKGYN
jgi:peroxiredoxin